MLHRAAQRRKRDERAAMQVLAYNVSLCIGGVVGAMVGGKKIPEYSDFFREDKRGEMTNDAIAAEISRLNRLFGGTETE